MVKSLFILILSLALPIHAAVTFGTGRVTGSLTIATPVVSWSPLDLRQVDIWLQASTITNANNTRISYWPDSSGQGNHFVQPDTAKQPIRIDGYEGYSSPVVFRTNAFTDSIREIYTCVPTVSMPITVSMVAINQTYSLKSPTAAGLFFGPTNATSVAAIYDYAGAQKLRLYNSGYADSSMIPPTNSWVLWTFTFTPTHSIAYANLTEVMSVEHNNSSAMSGMQLGNLAEGAGFDFFGAMAEVIRMKTNITTTELTNLYNYAHTKYGVSPPPEYSFMLDAVPYTSVVDNAGGDGYWYGTMFYVNQGSITVSKLGRVVETDNTSEHKIKILSFTDGDTKRLMCSNSIPTVGLTAGTTNYVAITPTVLTNGLYIIMVNESFNNDKKAPEHGIRINPDVGYHFKAVFSFYDPEFNYVYDGASTNTTSTPTFLYTK